MAPLKEGPGRKRRRAGQQTDHKIQHHHLATTTTSTTTTTTTTSIPSSCADAPPSSQRLMESEWWQELVDRLSPTLKTPGFCFPAPFFSFLTFLPLNSGSGLLWERFSLLEESFPAAFMRLFPRQSAKFVFIYVVLFWSLHSPLMFRVLSFFPHASRFVSAPLHRATPTSFLCSLIFPRENVRCYKLEVMWVNVPHLCLVFQLKVHNFDGVYFLCLLGKNLLYVCLTSWRFLLMNYVDRQRIIDNIAYHHIKLHIIIPCHRILLVTV